jgi:secreted trypsin-like serine protease
MPRCHLIVPVLLLLPACGDATPASPDAAPADASCDELVAQLERAVLGGDLDDGHPGVVAVNRLGAECVRAGDPWCTGTLVAPDRVVTAAHCVDPPAAIFYGVLLGPTADAGYGYLGVGLEGRFFRVARVRLHPGYDAATQANDLAVVELDQSADATPVPLLETSLDASDVGEALVVVGYGEAGEEPRFRKRVGTVVVTAVDASELRYEDAPAMTCSGDSGGPVLRAGADGERLAAVTSRGDPACVDHGVGARVDRPDVRAWILAP